MKTALFGRRLSSGRNPRRFFCPLVEPLESREMLAFNLTISEKETSGVDTTAGSKTTVFTAIANDANLAIADIESQLSAGINVLVDSGSSGTQAGNITSSAEMVLRNDTDTTLTIRSGASGGILFVGDISLAGIQLRSPGSLDIQADRNASLGGSYVATAISISARRGSVTMPTAGLLEASELTLTAGANIGSAALPVKTSAGELTTDTSSGDGNQFFTEANGLTAFDLQAGLGNINLNVALGSVTDSDAAIDIAASAATVNLNDSTSQNFGASNRFINTSVNDLSVVKSAGSGDLFIQEANGLAAVNLQALNLVSLILTAGALADTDSADDFSAAAVGIMLNDASAKNVGTAGNAIGVHGGILLVNTAPGGGDQFITQPLTDVGFFELNAGTGNINWTILDGRVRDNDSAADIIASTATVVLSDSDAKDFGTAALPIGTSVDSLSVSTAAGGGNQFITESDGLTALNLDAGTGNVTLTVALGAVTDSDGDVDIAATAAAISLNDSVGRNFGASLNRIQTNVVDLAVNTATGRGAQFITESDGLIGLNLNSGNSNIALLLSEGALADTDPDIDISAFSAAINFNSLTAQDFGASANPIGTDVNSLNVITGLGNGNQFIMEANGLVAFTLSAGAGNVTLNSTTGSIFDTDASIDIVAASATITLGDATTQHVGSFTSPIATNVSSLSASTAAGGSLFIAETDSTTVTNLDAGTGAVTLISGTFNLASANAIGDMSTLVVDSPAVLNLPSVVDGNEIAGGLAGSGTIAFPIDNLFQRLTVGGNNRDTTFSGSLTGNDTTVIVNDSLIKTGTGTLTLIGNNNFTGFYEVLAGKLLVTGSIGPGLGGVFARQAGILGGTGTINRLVAIDFGGHLAPGTSPGVLNFGSNLNLFPGSVFDLEITSAAAGSFDQARAVGLFLNTFGTGVALHPSRVGNISLQNGDQLMIVRNDGGAPVDGAFADLPEGANLGSNFLGSGLTANITYAGGDGNDVVISVSPGSLFPWHNEARPLDVRGGNTIEPDDFVDAGDALAIINYINSFDSPLVPDNAVLGLPFGFLDPTRDNNIAPDDALTIINAINAGLGGEGESGPMAPIGQQPDDNDAGPIGLDEMVVLLAMDLATKPKRPR